MKNEVIDKLSALSVAAFGLIAALAWNGAIRAIFDQYYAAGEGIGALVWYAVIVTLVAVFVAIGFAKAADRAKTMDLKSKLKKKQVE